MAPATLELPALVTDAAAWPDTALEAIVDRADFRAFVEAAWPVLEPVTPFVPGPHIDAICLHLQRLTETWETLRALSDAAAEAALAADPALIRNLLITLPPRMAKSTLVAVMWPAWVWTRLPGFRFLSTAYASDLALRDAVRTRRLLQSRWYQDRWGDRFALAGDQNVKARYENDRTGYRIAVGMGGAATGDGGDALLVDDPHNVRDFVGIPSEAARAGALEWFDGVFVSRRNDPKRSVMVVIQQRVHEEDLAGHLLAQGGWAHLNLPMEYEGDPNPTPIGWRDGRTALGQFLCPARFGPAEKAEALLRMGELTYAGQFQQRPVPAGGGILKAEHWRRYHRGELPARFKRVAAFADTAHKTGKTNDYTAIALWGEAEAGWWLLDLVHGRFEFPALLAEAQAAWSRWRGFPPGRRPTRFVIEDASSGTALIQALRHETKLPVTEYRADRDKIARVNAMSGYQQAGRLWLPADDAQGLGEFDVDGFIAEHTMFPHGRHDDRVDTTSCMMLYWEIEPPEQTAAPAGVATVGKAKGRW